MSIRILTWNLWWRYGPWRERLDAIVATLAAEGPDVCGLQEVWAAPDRHLAAELADRLGMHWCFAQATEAEHGGQRLGFGNAILSRWPIAAEARAPLPAPGIEGRVAAYARIDAPGGPLPIFTTHLTYVPGGSATRMAQVRRLAEFVAEQEPGAYPPVVMGDLNAEPDSDEIRLLSGLLTEPVVPGQVLVDAWRYADPADPGFTWDRRNGYQEDTNLPDSRIDFILVGLGKDARGRVLGARLAGNAPVDGVWPSDHFAVVAELEA
jgi:endonuclease/exonuclease/phosphatase family metal-dependent hydrolase